MRLVVSIVGALVVLVTVSCGPSIEQVELVGTTMGTTYRVLLVGKNMDHARLRAQIEIELERINAEMSTWREDSEISIFNREKTNNWQQISPGFMHVLSAAQVIHQKTDGAFDVTLGPLVELWGFGLVKHESIPSEASVAGLLAHTGPTKIEIDLSARAVRKNDPDVQLDLSGIAKGYAVDVVAGIVATAGIDDFLVEVGGEIRASGKRLDGTSWRVAIEKPDPLGRSTYLTLDLVDAAIATSGDYRNFFEIDGKRYSHIIDPATGRPPEHAVASASVVAVDATTADALATGLIVLGKESALSLANRHNIAVILIERYKTGYRVHRSNQFEALQTITVD